MENSVDSVDRFRLIAPCNIVFHRIVVVTIIQPVSRKPKNESKHFPLIARCAHFHPNGQHAYLFIHVAIVFRIA